MNNLPLTPDQLLTPEESYQVDSTLLPYRDKFAARLTIYAQRTLSTIAQTHDLRITELKTDEIANWVEQNQPVQPEDVSSGFTDWYVNILTASLQPLTQIAQANNVMIEALTIQQIISWFEEQVNLQMRQP
jgi:hypothetical protein